MVVVLGAQHVSGTWDRLGHGQHVSEVGEAIKPDVPQPLHPSGRAPRDTPAVADVVSARMFEKSVGDASPFDHGAHLQDSGTSGTFKFDGKCPVNPTLRRTFGVVF